MSEISDLRERIDRVQEQVEKAIGVVQIGEIEGLTVKKTAGTLLLSPTANNSIFVLTYINEIGDHITVPISTTSLHIEMQQEYTPFPTEKKIQVEAYQD